MYRRIAKRAFLGDSNGGVTAGGMYVFSFQSLGLHPLDSMLMSRLSGVPGLVVRKLDWTGGILGLFSNTLAITFSWQGGDADPNVLGMQIANALSGTLVGTFMFQGWQQLSAPPSTAAGAAPVSYQPTYGGLPPDVGTDSQVGSSLPWVWIAGGLLGAAVVIKAVRG
jgi:hypothetical protein